LACPDCGKAYIGQTGHPFSKRYNEHLRSFGNSCHTSKFAQHLNARMHNFGSIENIMQILYYQKKSPHLNTIERFYIHKEAATDNQLNDKQTIFPSKIFDTILNIGT
jgi:GIY-YIG catalytic domain.